MNAAPLPPPNPAERIHTPMRRRDLLGTLLGVAAMVGVASTIIVTLKDSHPLSSAAISDRRGEQLSDCTLGRLIAAHEEMGPQDPGQELANHTIVCVGQLGLEGRVTETLVYSAADAAYREYAELYGLDYQVD